MKARVAAMVSSSVVLAAAAVAGAQVIAVEGFPAPPYTAVNLNTQVANIANSSFGFGSNPWNTNTGNVVGNTASNPFAGWAWSSPGRMNSLGFLPDTNIRGGWRTLATYTPANTYYMGGIYAASTNTLNSFAVTGFMNGYTGAFNDYRGVFENGATSAPNPGGGTFSGVRGLLWGNDASDLVMRTNNGVTGMVSTVLVPNFVRNSFYMMAFKVEFNASGNDERITYWVTNSSGTVDRSNGEAGLSASAGMVTGTVLANIMDTNADLQRLQHVTKFNGQTFQDEMVLGRSLTDLIVPQYRWLTNGNGNWNDAVNWSYNTVPNAVGAEVRFAPGLAASPVITLTSDVIVGSVLYASANTYTITGTNSVTLNAAGTPTLTVAAGNSVISAPVKLAKNSTVTLTGGATLRINDIRGNAGTETLTVNGLGDLIIGDTYVGGRILPQLSAIDGTTYEGLALFVPGAEGIVRGGVVATMREMIKQWWANGARTGGGLGATTSVAFTTLGLITNDVGNGFFEFTSFAGIPVTATDVIVKATYLGDCNLDGKVDAVDFNLLLNGMTNNLSGWYNGDINYDGIVSGEDYALLLQGLAGQGAPLTGSLSGGAAIPEPASAGLALGLGGLLLARRRR
jgi:hypothetical protein